MMTSWNQLDRIQDYLGDRQCLWPMVVILTTLTEVRKRAHCGWCHPLTVILTVQMEKEK